MHSAATAMTAVAIHPRASKLRRDVRFWPRAAVSTASADFRSREQIGAVHPVATESDGARDLAGQFGDPNRNVQLLERSDDHCVEVGHRSWLKGNLSSSAIAAGYNELVLSEIELDLERSTLVGNQRCRQ